MSVSPQSLARTRDKRSHKVPARFTDTVTPLKDATEVQVRTSTRSRPGSLIVKREHEDDGEEKEEVLKVLKGAFRPTVTYKKQTKTGSHSETLAPTRPLVESLIDPNSPSTPPPSTTPSPVSIPIVQPPQPIVTPKQPTINNNISCTNNSNSINNNISSSNNNNPIKKVSSSSSSMSSKRNKSTGPKGLSLIVRQQPGGQDDQPSQQATTPRQTSTATISGGVSNFNIHQISSNPLNTINPTTNLAVASSPVTMIATMPSAMAAPTTAPAPTLAPAAQMPAPASVPTPTATLAQPSTPTQIHQGARYFNPLGTQQYGTRLLINEPILLPRSVAPIAPITATLHQIALLARKPPFISRKAEACLAYQDERRLSFITSNFATLIMIAKYLGIRDRLSLRLVSRTWKSVIECEAVWKTVVISPDDYSLDMPHLAERFIGRYRTTDLIYTAYELKKKDGCTGYEQVKNMTALVCTHFRYLKRVFIKSVNKHQNSIAYAFLHGFLENCSKSAEQKCPGAKTQFNWEIKVGVDPLGIATVDLDRSVVRDSSLRFREADGCIELYDLKEKYEKDLSVKVTIVEI